MDAESNNLADRVRAGDSESLTEFMELHRPQLAAFIDRKLGPALRSKVEVDDLIQEVHIDCHRALADVKLGDRDPFSWLCQVAGSRLSGAHSAVSPTECEPSPTAAASTILVSGSAVLLIDAPTIC